MCLYITFLTDSLKYSTICNYISAIWSLHDFAGVHPPAKGSFLVKCTLMGARRLLGDAVLSADPLLPDDLYMLYSHLCKTKMFDLVFWAAVCLMFRCLLRVGHVTKSDHTIHRNDVVFTSYGFCLTIRSSKTIQYQERELSIPVIASPGSLLCPVFWLKRYFSRVKVPPHAPLFLDPGSQKPLSYKSFSTKLKGVINAAQLLGKYSSHSLRRGAATFLSRIGLPLHDIKTAGDWRSLSVLLYLSGDIKTRLIKDRSVAQSLLNYHF